VGCNACTITNAFIEGAMGSDMLACRKVKEMRKDFKYLQARDLAASSPCWTWSNSQSA
jgi:uncharacterized phage-like protein YoqJ